MTTQIAAIPLAIGASAADIAGHVFGWAAERFLRAPMASTGLILISGLTLVAGTNALYMQDVRHPAPLFGAVSSASRPAQPVVIAPETVPERPSASPRVSEPAAPELATTSSTQEPASAPTAQEPADPVRIGNQNIADMQEKLKEMGLFDGVVDGYYGPKTADAIRRFETRFDLPQTGAATPQLIEAVLQASVQTSQVTANVVQPATPDPAPVADQAPSDEIAPLLAQMSEESRPTPPATQDQQVIADVAPRQQTLPEPQAQVAEAEIPAALDQNLVGDIQRGLARLGFLQGSVNGVPDEATARAIRKFQIFNNFVPTGEVSPRVREMLVSAGAYL